MSDDHRDHPHADPLLFKEDRHTAVFVCDRVAKKESPILFVSHDEEGDWQFLCGGQHGDGQKEDRVRIVCLEHVVTWDGSLNELANMHPNHSATRSAPDRRWSIADETETQINTLIESGIWWIGLIEDEPTFAYTVGLQRLFKHPELILVGLPHETAGGILNLIGERIRAGERFDGGSIVEGVLQNDIALRLRAVTSREAYREHVGYALWFYGGDWFPLLQCLWPDKGARYPGDDGFALNDLQPLL
jgi:hypothetical protein